jgi:hypothetical protein
MIPANAIVQSWLHFNEAVVGSKLMQHAEGVACARGRRHAWATLVLVNWQITRQDLPGCF